MSIWLTEHSPDKEVKYCMLCLDRCGPTEPTALMEIFPI